MNLILKDFEKLDDVASIAFSASNISKFIYNHCSVLNLMRIVTSGSKLLHPTPTPFVTNFIAIQSLLAFKQQLQSMVTSKGLLELSHYKDSYEKQVAKTILDSFFREIVQW